MAIETSTTPITPAADPSGAPSIVDPAWDAAAVEALRTREYGRLDATGHVYLDYTGGGLYAESQLHEHADMLRDGVFGNPHSDSPASGAATRLADDTRAAILRFLGASADEYAVVFTSNASAALKLIGEAYPFEAGSRYLLTADNHNSVNGIREYARARGADVTYVPLEVPELRIGDDAILAELDRPATGSPRLFAYPAQSNYSGVRHPLAWVGLARERGWDVLLDAAAFVPTNPLDLSVVKPDFVTISWYKAFGYPTGLGSLVVRHDALRRLRRPWFAGGTIGVAAVSPPRHTMGDGTIAFEDGTIDYLGVPAIEVGLRHLDSVGMPVIHGRVQALTASLLPRLTGLRHHDGSPVIRLYGPTGMTDRGGTIPFNVLRPDGSVVGFWEVDAAAAAAGISVRTGCFCNPGASETARGLTEDEMERVFALGRQPSLDDLAAIMPGKALGAVRVSLGIATTEGDLDRFVAFLAERWAARA